MAGELEVLEFKERGIELGFCRQAEEGVHVRKQ